MSSAIKVVEKSDNSKLGRVSATYASQSTCPRSCGLFESGCYAEGGFIGRFILPHLNESEDSALPVEELAFHEAMGIAGLSGELPLRLHVVGDATTDEGARLLASAAEYHTNKHNQPVWTYTHAWREVKRFSWGKVNVLASCESLEQVRDAQSRGYAAAIVVNHHESDKAYVKDGVKLIPCPQQTGRAENCLSCKLCFKADLLLSQGAAIAFEVHGQQSNKAKEMLIQINLGE